MHLLEDLEIDNSRAVTETPNETVGKPGSWSIRPYSVWHGDSSSKVWFHASPKPSFPRKHLEKHTMRRHHLPLDSRQSFLVSQCMAWSNTSEIQWKPMLSKPLVHGIEKRQIFSAPQTKPPLPRPSVRTLEPCLAGSVCPALGLHGVKGSQAGQNDLKRGYSLSRNDNRCRQLRLAPLDFPHH